MKRSFTLIELVIVIGIMSMVGLLLIVFVKNGYDIYLRGQINSTITAEAHDLSSRIANGLRGTFKVLAASNTSFSAQTYFAPNDTSPTQIIITKDGATVTMSTIQGVLQGDGTYVYNAGTSVTKTITTHFMTNPATPLFQYYNELGVMLGSPVDINNVHLIGINATIYSTLDMTKTSTGTTRVEFRNLKTNL